MDKMLQITEEARKELQRFSQEELYDGEFIRIARSYQCGGSKFQLTVDEAKTAVDEAITVDGVEIIVDKTCLELLQGTELDFAGEGFLFMDDLGNRC